MGVVNNVLMILVINVRMRRCLVNSWKVNRRKKFGCDLCPTRTEKDPVTGKMITIYTKLYARRTDLLDHKTSKHGGNPKPYACEVCGKRYANKANVSRHKKKAHNGGDVDSVKKKKKKGKTEKKNKSTENIKIKNN